MFLMLIAIKSIPKRCKLKSRNSKSGAPYHKSAIAFFFERPNFIAAAAEQEGPEGRMAQVDGAVQSADMHARSISH